MLEVGGKDLTVLFFFIYRIHRKSSNELQFSFRQRTEQSFFFNVSAKKSALYFTWN